LTYDALGRTAQRIEEEGTTTWTSGKTASSHNIGTLSQLAGPTDMDTYRGAAAVHDK
jgi:hypothetical protein